MEIVLFILLGFVAQLIDGSLGMAYGVFLSSILSFFGFSPAHISAAVHISETTTTSVSGLSHLKFKNFDKNLFKKLLIPGIIGGLAGVVFIFFVEANFIRPFIYVYLLLLGLRLVYKAFSHSINTHTLKIPPLGLLGGFFDAIGGGGWGPIVTGSLLSHGTSPRVAIGTANCVEFFVAAVQSAFFIGLLGTIDWEMVLSLIVGGFLAAPLAAFTCTKINPHWLTGLVGTLICILNLFALGRFFF